MVQKIGSAISGQIIQLITAPVGANSTLAALSAADSAPAAALDTAQIRAQNVAPDLMERGETVSYPAVNVYCEKLVNALTEKSRSFSGSAHMVVEVRHSHDRLEGLQDALELYTDAVTATLGASRGDWGNGMFYAGGYEVSFTAVKHGGRNFIQTAKIALEIGVSIN
jgi:hypothetical protein